MYQGTLAPASNQATWAESAELTDAEDGDPIDLSSATEIAVTVRDPQSRTSVLTLTMTGGQITIPAVGVFSWRVDSGQMGALVAKTYEVGCVISDTDGDVQLFIGYLPVLDGIVQ